MSKQDRIGCVGRDNDCACLSHRQGRFKSHIAHAIQRAFLEHMHHDHSVETIEFSGHVKRFHDEDETVIGTVTDVRCMMSLREFGVTAFFELDR